jgi:hypothetical protein
MIQELRRIHLRRIARLRELSVDVRELPVAEGREALSRFAGAFLGPERAAAFLGEVEAARGSHREIEYERWLWRGAPPPALKPRFGWLSDWMPGRTCVRFDRRAGLSALRFSTYTIPDEWVLSWPGAYVCFETGRAMVVSLDYEVGCFDLSAPAGRSPYR